MFEISEKQVLSNDDLLVVLLIDMKRPQHINVSGVSLKNYTQYCPLYRFDNLDVYSYPISKHDIK